MSSSAPTPDRSIPLADLRVRRREPELMDQPDLDPEAHRDALRALSRVHRLSGTGGRLRRVLDDIARRVPIDEPVRMLDVACGGGDAVLDAVRWARDRGRDLRVVGLDMSELALDFGAERARREGGSGKGEATNREAEIDVVWTRGDALSELPPGPFDLVFSSLFLHHLSEARVVSLLAAVRERSARIRVEDLRRTRLGYLLAWTTLRAVSGSRIAHVDGPRSVRAGWRRPELLQLAEQAGLSGCRLRPVWPQRIALAWDR